MLLGRRNCRLEDNITITVREVSYEYVHWIHKAQDRSSDRFWGHSNEFLYSIKGGEFVGKMSANFSKGLLCCVIIFIWRPVKFAYARNHLRPMELFCRHILYLRKVSIGSVMSDLQSVLKYHCGSHWMELCEICYQEFMSTSVEKIQICVQLGRNIRCFT